MYANFVPKAIDKVIFMVYNKSIKTSERQKWYKRSIEIMKKIYGYCRVSTPTQSIERQKRNILSKYPTAELYCEAYTGTTLDRPEWCRLKKLLKAGDTLIFDEISRMSRNANEGIELYMELYHKGVTLEFIKEPQCNTATYDEALKKRIDLVSNSGDEATDKFMQAIQAALNEFMIDLAKKQIALAFNGAEHEVQTLRQRTREGIETARRNGKQIGQQTGKKLHTKRSAEVKQIIIDKSKDLNGVMYDTELIAYIKGTTAGGKFSRNSFYKYKSELKQDK